MKDLFLGYMVDEDEKEQIKAQIREHILNGETNFNISVPEEFNDQDYEALIQEVIEELSW